MVDRNTDDLLLSYLDDRLDDGQFQAFASRLGQDPALRRELLLLSSDEDALQEWADISSATAIEYETVYENDLVEAPPRSSKSWWNSKALFWLGGAGVLAAMVALAVLLWQPSEIAHIARAIDVRYDGKVFSGARPGVAVGERIALERGMIELAYHNGIRVVVEGPAELTLTSERELLLLHGQLAVDVDQAAPLPNHANKFTVRTDDAVFVDRGTRFAVAVEPQGKAELVVFEGEVEAKFAKQSEQAGSLVMSGEAVALTAANGQVVAAPEAVQRVVRLKEVLYELSVPAADDHFVWARPEEQSRVATSAGGPESPRLLVSAGKHRDDRRKSWVRFDLSGINFDPEKSATFVVRHDEPARQADYRGMIEVYALNPNFEPFPGQLDYRWREHKLSWQSAPGNHPSSGSLKTGRGQLLETISLNTTAAGQPAGTTYEVTIPRLGDFLQPDDSVTIVLCGASQSVDGTVLELASAENTSIAGPELIVHLQRNDSALAAD